MMKKLFLASLAIAALASCQKESFVDSTLTSGQQEMTFAPYAGASLTKGSAVGSNTDFQGEDDSYNSFKVSAHNGTASYYGFDQITYNGSTWEGETTRYWPVDYPTMYFGAYYPADATFTTNTDPAYSYADAALSLKFDYTVGAVATQKDLMYAITEKTATAEDYNIPLHFKHALTQIGFTATKTSADINVTVSSITICNVVDNGAFEATTNTNNSGAITSDQNSTVATSAGDIWTPATAVALKDDGSVTTTNLTNYAATMKSTGGIAVTSSSEAVTLTSADDVLMLLPQTLTAWVPNDDKYPYDSSIECIAYGTDSYLAIECVITGADSEVIIDGTIYVPFDTAGIEYKLTEDAGDGTWLPGYKITYNLDFGGGYAIPGTDPDPGPQPGEVPDNVVPTLRPITYTVTVDEWIPVAGDDVSL